MTTEKAFRAWKKNVFLYLLNARMEVALPKSTTEPRGLIASN